MTEISSTLKRSVINIHRIYCILGRTCSGKSTLAKDVANRLGLKILKSYATRPMRDGETKENSDHTFIRSEEVEAFRDEMVAYTQIGEYEYFATKSQLMDCDVYIIDPRGLYELLIKTKGMKIQIVPIYITVPKRVLLERAKSRKDDMDVFTKRYDDENQRFTVFEKSNMIDYRVLNDCSFEKASQKLEHAIKKEMKRAENEEKFMRSVNDNGRIRINL